MLTVIFIFVGFLGLISHWFKRYVRKQCDKSFMAYMTDDWKHSVASIITMVAAVLSLSGHDLSQEALSMAFLAGYSIDSMVNK
jgi:hypothetical protein